MNKTLFGIVGWKNTGKTTLVTRLVEVFTARGFTISTVKHAHVAFDIDHPGTDSFRHRAAGAREVALVSPARWALMHESKGEDEACLDEMVAKLAPCHLVLVEGFKSEPHRKIEVMREAARSRPPVWQGDENVVAIAADGPVEGCDRPLFDIDDIAAIADFIQSETGILL